MLRFALALCLLATPALADDQAYFRSPSGNIHCMIVTGDTAFVRCDMVQLTRTYTKAPANCFYDWGSSFLVGRRYSKGEVACVSDTVATPRSKVLNYGESLKVGNFTCTSDKSGMTCVNMLGHGFTLSKAKQQVF